jgi:hypothetical protein
MFSEPKRRGTGNFEDSLRFPREVAGGVPVEGGTGVLPCEMDPRPAVMNLPIPCTPSLMPSRTTPLLVVAVLVVREEAVEGVDGERKLLCEAFSNPRLIIRSHLRFTKGVQQ